LERAEADWAVSRRRADGSGRVFSGGRRHSRIRHPQGAGTTDLPTLIATVEELRKPVIAGIDGVCMGGGLELAAGL